LGKTLGLDREWFNEDKGIAFFRFPGGQEVEVYSAANRQPRVLSLSQKLSQLKIRVMTSIAAIATYRKHG
jgi:hypothetical protein